MSERERDRKLGDGLEVQVEILTYSIFVLGLFLASVSDFHSTGFESILEPTVIDWQSV